MSDLMLQEVPRGQAASFPGANQNGPVVTELVEEFPGQFHRGKGHAHRAVGNPGLGPHTFARAEGALEGAQQSGTGFVVTAGQAVGVLELGRYLGLADHHALKAGRYMVKMPHGVELGPSAGVTGKEEVGIRSHDGQPFPEQRIHIGSPDDLQIDLGPVAGRNRDHRDAAVFTDTWYVFLVGDMTSQRIHQGIRPVRFEVGFFPHLGRGVLVVDAAHMQGGGTDHVSSPSTRTSMSAAESVVPERVSIG